MKIFALRLVQHQQRPAVLLVLFCLCSAISSGSSTQVEWLQWGSTVDGQASGDGAGWSVALSADAQTLAVGATKNAKTGSVSVYRWISEDWQQMGDVIEGEHKYEDFGSAVALSADGNTIAASSPLGDYVRAFYWDEWTAVWQKMGEDLAVQNEFGRQAMFGSSLALSASGTIMAVGAPWYGNTYGYNAGQVFIYQFKSGAWEPYGTPIEGEDVEGEFGFSLSLDENGQTLAIGQRLKEGARGAPVRIYRFSDDDWKHDEDLEAGRSDEGMGFSVSLSSDGNKLAVSAPFAYENMGVVRIYSSNGKRWKFDYIILGETAGEFFGSSVSLNGPGDVVVVGASSFGPYDKENGQVRVFKDMGYHWKSLGQNVNGLGEDDRFGRSTSISKDGEVFAAGAFQADGINGDNAGQTRTFHLVNITSTPTAAPTDTTLDSEEPTPSPSAQTTRGSDNEGGDSDWNQQGEEQCVDEDGDCAFGQACCDGLRCYNKRGKMQCLTCQAKGEGCERTKDCCKGLRCDQEEGVCVERW